MTEVPKPTKLGEAALKNMQLLKTESSVFKVPKVPHKKSCDKKRATVLDEDVYVEGIAKIIQRDFFPDLEKLKAQNEFLEASENKDYMRLRELTRKYSGNRPATEPYNSPATFDTPDIDRPGSPAAPVRARDASPTHPAPHAAHQAAVKPKDITDNHTLDSYLACHTSEDNASYDRVIALEQKKRAGKLAPALAAEAESSARADAALMLPSIDQQADHTNRPLELDTWRYAARNYIMYVPAGAASQRAPRKPELRRRNTRLRAPPFDHQRDQAHISALARTQEASISGKIGVDGASVPASSETAGYALVEPPSPRPGAGPDASPLMTWGHIEGTPFRLDGSDTPLPAIGSGAAYRMLEGGARERIALQLAERAAQRRRPPTERAPTPSYRSNTERLASMSPAARLLATKHLLSPRLKLTPNDMGILAHVATPKRTPTPQRRPLVATPNLKKAPANTDSAPENNLTDNLLQINVEKRSRLTAQDFFK